MNNQQWQPIETAPKDGTRILAHGRGVPGGGIVWNDASIEPMQTVIFWREHWDDDFEEAPEGSGNFKKVRKVMLSLWVSNENGFKPTHWMPLPAAPTTRL